MQKFKKFSLTGVLALVILTIVGCNFSTANLSSLKTSKDKAGTTEATSFKAGETLFAKAAVSNNPGKVKVKLSISDPKGETIKGTEVSVDVNGDGGADYSLPIMEDMATGSYKLTADMLNEEGEKKDSKNTTFSITE